MSSELLLYTLLWIGASTLILIALVQRVRGGSAVAVLENLAATYSDTEGEGTERGDRPSVSAPEMLSRAGATQRISVLLVAGIAVGFLVASTTGVIPSALAPWIIVAGGVLVFAARLRGRRLQERSEADLHFFLPIVMERMVMAVQSGLDIQAALRAVVALDGEGTRSARSGDPVTTLLQRAIAMVDGGFSLSQALQESAASVRCVAIRHAFSHLALAYSEGGEVVAALKELSEATQLQYQETVDQQIAALPIKATLPLLCTFSGLVLSFVTTPVIQIMATTASTTPGVAP